MYLVLIYPRWPFFSALQFFNLESLFTWFSLLMAQTIASFDTAHAGTIHDAQVDYYGKRLATASSDNSVRLWDISEQQVFLAELRGHDAPVWQAVWSHPKFGSLLATCSYDKAVIIWKETRPGQWEQIYKDLSHSGSVNSIAWCPWEFGLALATASSDGSIGILTFRGGNIWERKQITRAHAYGVNAVSWAPATSPATLASGPAIEAAQLGTKRLVSGGSDNRVKLWRFEEADGEWREVDSEKFNDHTPHSDWVRDVAWRPNVGIPSNTIASCSEDKSVLIWQQDMEGKPWKVAYTLNMAAPVWRLSWSVTGSLLAVACADNTVSLFKESADTGDWVLVNSLNEQGVNNPTL